ncbi:uncharacterized protein LOC110819746 isoform X2 [Carica papaya]|uniref:uncharacterized protein LOC110819746 isoform X2 n=1 Tax=Carica papaya TaxID=3649 RepID=UPI000B8CF5AB|nr:uncharacterized protein LOC110819746 isoform X2 [Carica papaya]
MQTLKKYLISNKLHLNSESSFGFLSSPALLSNSSTDYLKINYLIRSWSFSTSKFLQKLGFSNTQMQSAVRVAPRILLSDIDRTLKPKIQFFQEEGFVGSDLAEFISKNSSVLSFSLNRRLAPCVEILKKVLLNDKSNKGLIPVLKRCSWLVCAHPELVLSRNIAFLNSCGIVGSQLAWLLRRQPRLFVRPDSVVRDNVSRALDMGFSVNSRMLVYAVYTISCLSEKSLKKKFELIRSYGFSENESMMMFRKAPLLLMASEDKLKLGIEFFLNIMGFKKELLIGRPACLMHSLEDRIFPRYRVLQVLRSKEFLKRNMSFLELVALTEEKFIEKFISRFKDDVEELLVAYKSHLLDSSSSSDEEGPCKGEFTNSS